MAVSNWRNYFSASVLLSLFVHVLFFAACLTLMRARVAATPDKKTQWIQVEVAPPPKPATGETKLRHQIVETEAGQIVKKAADNALLGEKTQVVDRETVNAAQTALSQVPAHRPPKAQRAQAKSATLPALSQLGLAMLPKLDKPQEPLAEEPKEWADQGKTGAHDFVKGVKESERTALNTKEFVFYGYFQRIRKRLDMAWVPILRERIEKIYRSGRQLASDMDHETRVLVVLDVRGEVKRVQIVSESGTQDLDDAAVRAFNEAGPFPNPPHGIVDNNQEIQIPWEFILKT
jgi:TonB family protein